MSVMGKNIIMSGILTTVGTSALAATDGRAHPDNLAVWIFLGFCALIIVAQIAPLIWIVKRHIKLAAREAKTSEQTNVN